MSSLSEYIKDCLSLSEGKKRQKQQKSKEKKKNKKSKWSDILQLKEKEPEVVVVEDTPAPLGPIVILPLSTQKTAKLLGYIDSLVGATSSSSSSSYDAIQEWWHYLSKEIQASHKPSKVKRLMRLYLTSPPSSSLNPVLAHKLRTVYFID